MVWYFWAERETSEKKSPKQTRAENAVASLSYLQTAKASHKRGPRGGGHRTDNLVDRVVIVKGHEAKSPLLAGRALLHDVDALDLAVLLKVLPDVVLLRVLLDAADKDLLHRQVGAGFVGVLGRGLGIIGGRVGMTVQDGAARCPGVFRYLLIYLFILSPPWTRPAWVQRPARPPCGASLSWPRRPPPPRST